MAAKSECIWWHTVASPLAVGWLDAERWRAERNCHAPQRCRLSICVRACEPAEGCRVTIQATATTTLGSEPV